MSAAAVSGLTRAGGRVGRVELVLVDFDPLFFSRVVQGFVGVVVTTGVRVAKRYAGADVFFVGRRVVLGARGVDEVNA